MFKSKIEQYFGRGWGLKVSSLLGIKPPSVYGWPDPIPELRARQLDELTSGELKFNPEDYRKSSH